MILEDVRARLQTEIPGCQVDLVVNGSPSAQNSLLIDRVQKFGNPHPASVVQPQAHSLRFVPEDEA